jgi:hypothetical protein
MCPINHTTHGSTSALRPPNTPSLPSAQDTPEEARNWLFYASLRIIADALDVILTSVIPEHRRELARLVASVMWWCVGGCPAVGLRPA